MRDEGEVSPFVLGVRDEHHRDSVYLHRDSRGLDVNDTGVGSWKRQRPFLWPTLGDLSIAKATATVLFFIFANFTMAVTLGLFQPCRISRVSV